MIVGSFDISPKTTEEGEGSSTENQSRVSVGPVPQSLGWPQVLPSAGARGRRAGTQEKSRSWVSMRPAVNKARLEAAEGIQFLGTCALEKALLWGPEEARVSWVAMRQCGLNHSTPPSGLVSLYFL